jgi:23S rRNA (cytidine1920-2'-O)/16S rRNA (cytidine1409-2'-O)-methyltransferase
MPRLDVWLVETGQFFSRQAAKRAIKDGYVTVDGRSCKPSTHITGHESILIHTSAVDAPKGFYKLQRIDDILGGELVRNSCVALDIGSSAGGFLAYLSHKGAVATGVEVSDRFTKELQSLVDSNPNLSIIFGDAFEMDPISVAAEDSLDLLLIDVTTDLSGTLMLISRYKTLLKRGGYLVAAFKMENQDEAVLQVLSQVQEMGFGRPRSIYLDESRQEVHVVACHM